MSAPSDALRLAVANLEDMVRRQACGDRSEAAVAKARDRVFALDANAPWLTQAHILCTDQGIPHGHIQDRIAALSEKLAIPEGAVRPAAWVDLNDAQPEPEVFVLTWDGKKVGVDWWGSLRHRGDGVTHWTPFAKPPRAGPMYGFHSIPGYANGITGSDE